MKRSTVEIAVASSALTRNASLGGEGAAVAATGLTLGIESESTAPDRPVVADEDVITAVGVGAGGLAQETSWLAAMANASGRRKRCFRTAVMTTFYTRLTSRASRRARAAMHAPRRHAQRRR